MVPWHLIRLLAVALATWAVSALYSLRLNPEVAFYRHGDQIKRTWAEKLEREHKSKIVVVGGSSCATSIDGERMLSTHSLPVLNLGMSAGMGAKILVRYGLHALQPGDTLILSIEPDLLNVPLENEPLGVQFSLATGAPDLLRDPDQIQWTKALLSLRPGSYHVFTLLGKITLGKPLYRYHPSHFHASGWQEGVVKRDFPDRETPAAPLILSREAGELLASVRAFCDQRRIRVAYSIPWRYCPESLLAETRSANFRFLCQVAQFVPVFTQAEWGAHPVRAHFADTDLHPTAEGASTWTDQMALQIKQWQPATWKDLQQPSPLEPAVSQ